MNTEQVIRASWMCEKNFFDNNTIYIEIMIIKVSHFNSYYINYLMWFYKHMCIYSLITMKILNTALQSELFFFYNSQAFQKKILFFGNQHFVVTKI